MTLQKSIFRQWLFLGTCLIPLVFILSGCNDSNSSATDALQNNMLTATALSNTAPYIPAQCYTKTADNSGAIHNSCYTCHTTGLRPDFINDDELQLEYAFPDYADKNHWDNLFKDWSSRISAISDTQILDYIRTSNYVDAEGRIILADTLAQVPDQWDYDQDGHWSGYVPDCYFNIDDEGFDHDRSGGYTGWRAYAYYPFPTTHWPANGSTADVLIRLPETFQTSDNLFNKDVYKLNLAILESVIKQTDISITLTDETVYGVDLDKNGILETADRITYDWAPLEGKYMYYVGDALIKQQMDEIHLAAGLFPAGTEFINTVHYIDVSETKGDRMADRMKEIRYAKKLKWLTYAELETLALNEVKERDDFPDRLKMPIGNIEDGISNGVGWELCGFIEQSDGALRPQTFEETASCIGCHGGIGATTDSIFSFKRKLSHESFQAGWFHWSQKGLTGINEPKVAFKNAGVQYEYCFYLMYSGAGDEFRANVDITDMFFDTGGYLKPDMAQLLHDDISLLLYPSRQRALSLNKAYKAIVEEQSFTLGRDIVIGAAATVYDQILSAEVETKVTQPVVLADSARDFPCEDCAMTAVAPVSEQFRAAVSGNSMGGPDGKFYRISWEGVIDKSTYGISTDGFYFPFPERHTLPTRFLVPNSNIPACYACHRLTGPVPTGAPQVQPVNMPATEATEDGLVLKRLTDDPANDLTGIWRPDGEKIAWVSDRSGSYQIWVMNRDGSEEQQVTRGPGIHAWHMWSPNSDRLVYWGYDEQTKQSAISTCLEDGTDEIIVVESEEALDKPVFSPDGQYIAYAAETNGNWNIWVARSDGSEFFQLTDDPQMETNPLWRPDGMALAYKACASGDYGLCGEEFLTFENGFDQPTIFKWNGPKSIQMYDWSPDGEKIAYTAEIVTNASGEDRVSYLAMVDRITLENGNTTNRAEVLSKRSTLGDRGPVFSPDSKKIAFWSWDKAYRATLWIAEADGENLLQLTTQGFDMYPRWHPEGNTLVFESNRMGNMDIWTVEVK
jgi:Tol biopolymer transport system component